MHFFYFLGSILNAFLKAIRRSMSTSSTSTVVGTSEGKDEVVSMEGEFVDCDRVGRIFSLSVREKKNNKIVNESGAIVTQL